MAKIKTYRSDGSDGYSEGTYGVTVSGAYADGTTWRTGDGGFASPEHARERGQEIAEASAEASACVAS